MSIPTVWHDDGIYKLKQELAFGQTPVAEFARRVIEAWGEKERTRIGKLRSPVTTIGGVPKRVIMQQMKRTAGSITFAPTQLFCFSTKEEHRNASKLDSFFEHPFPVYDDKETAIRFHGEHCWKMALLNAYRILDLTKDTTIPFPHGWEPILVGPRKRNYAGLLSSAAYQMGLYYAMALALPNARISNRGAQMSKGNRGNFSELGELVYAACDEIVRRQGTLPEWNASTNVMSILEERRQASTKQGLWVVFVGKKKMEMDSRKLGKFIRRYRDRALQ